MSGLKQTNIDTENSKPLQSINQNELSELKSKLYSLNEISPQTRGFAFEKFLNKLFSMYNLAPRGSFRLTGEQIDGSFQLDRFTYLVEAKWQERQVGNSDLLAFKGKVAGKAIWSRGIYISYSGFTPDGLIAFSKAGSTNIIGITGQDIHFILEGELSFVEAIQLKTRYAAETGEFWISVFDLRRGH
ncbi:restriction endonuclease [Candidatus Sumerlaeota bacterium]|nr:restriction endonuclease [Candidatus Sumerlaeota bacterium]